jgi:hypothetical protein
MVALRVEIEPSDNLEGCRILIDEERVDWDGGNPNVGRVPVDGSCGDGSEHRLNYRISGPTGATCTISVSCGGSEVLKLEDIKIIHEPTATGWEEFKI